MRAPFRNLRVLLPIAIILALLLLVPSDRAVEIVFLSLVGTFSSLAGRELATFVPLKAATIGGALIWAGVAFVYAGGFVVRDPRFSGYLAYLAIAMIGVCIPLSAVIEGVRKQRRRD